MNGKIKNILKLICGMNGSSAGILLKISNDDYTIRAVHGQLNQNDTTLKDFCDDLRISQNFTADKIYQLDSYSAFAEKNNFKSLTIKEIFNSVNFKLMLICLSEQKELQSIEAANLDTASEMLFDFWEDENNISDEMELQKTIEKANLAVLFSDVEGNPVYINDRFRETFNTEDDVEFVNNNFFLFDEDGNLVDNFDFPFKVAIRNNKSINDRKYKFINSNGEERWFRVNSVIVPEASDSASKVLTTFEDITTLMDIKQRMNYEIAPPDVVYYSSDPSGSEYSFISDSAKKLFGYQPDEVFDNRYMIQSRIYPEHLDDYKKFIRDVSRGSQLAIEYKIRDSKNNMRFVRHIGIPVLENYEVVKVVGVITDITNEKKISEKLKYSEDKLNLVLDNSAEFIFSLNENFEIEIINQLGARFLGYEPEELVGCLLSEFLKDENKNEVTNIFAEIKKSEKLKSFTALFRAKNHKTVKIEIKARAVQYGGGEKNIIGVGKNISEYQKDEIKIKELTDKLNEANRIIESEKNKANQQLNVAEELNRLKNDFISNISHELRTPLTSIVGFAETISSDKELDREMVSEFSSVILEEGKRLSRLINEILDFSEYEAGIRKLIKSEFNVSGMLNQLIEAVKEQFDEKGISLNLINNSADPNLVGDRLTLYKAFDNLLSNALKFTKPGGKVEVVINQKDELLEFVVSDTGVGIHETDIPKLFQKFRKLSRTGSQIPGAGFGLVTVQQIIDLHYGTINIDSKLHKGTNITVRIPKNLASGGKR